LILRIQPHYSHWLNTSAISQDTQTLSSKQRLNAFFAQEWVQHGDPEILFIKRAASNKDHWTSHVAFPGGRKDPEDEDDCETAIRETWEEVGIDLREESGYAVHCGNTEQSIITSNWGKKA
jgi:8-oxo-dGTP pyrophosphatase MutT (NUDIX family)